MVRSGSVRHLLAPLGAAIWLVSVAAGAVLGGNVETCSVRVEPRAAPAGSVFVFSGTGFAPTELELARGNGAPSIHPLVPADDDPWEVSVRSRVGDEGTWTATFSEEDVCTATVKFRVTLSNTDTLADVTETGSGQPWILYLAVVAFGFVGGRAIARAAHTHRFVFASDGANE